MMLDNMQDARLKMCTPSNTAQGRYVQKSSVACQNTPLEVCLQALAHHAQHSRSVCAKTAGHPMLQPVLLRGKVISGRTNKQHGPLQRGLKTMSRFTSSDGSWLMQWLISVAARETRQNIPDSWYDKTLVR